MKHFKLVLAVLLAGSLLGAGCNFKSIEETQTETKSPADILLEQRMDDLAKKEADLKKKEAELEKQKEDLAAEEEVKDGEVMDELGPEGEVVDDDNANAPADIDSDSKTEEPKNLNERGREILNEVTLEADDTSIVVMLVASETYSDQGAAFTIGCEDKLIPFKIETGEKTQSDLATAIVTLLSTKKYAYDQSDALVNHVSGVGLTLANVKYEDGKRVVEFEGQATSSGTCESPRIKAQIEETVALYSSNFEIRLNGGESNWRCLFDESGLCE